MALIVPLVAARNRTPSSTAFVSFADRLAGTASGPQRLHGQACASRAARRVPARAATTRTSHEGPAALRFMCVVRALRERRDRYRHETRRGRRASWLSRMIGPRVYVIRPGHAT